jgi:ribonuclease P/MRP protein subunit RPP40
MRRTEADISLRDGFESKSRKRAARTAQTVLGQLARGIHNRDRNIFLRLYQQYVRLHLVFGSPAWSPWQEGDKECLEKVQRRAVGMIAGLKSRDYNERLKELGLTTMEERRHQLDMVQVYKIVNGAGGVNSEQWFKMAENARETRKMDPMNIRIQAARLEIRRNFFSRPH